MKIIFLDIDGVLNTDKTKERINGFIFVDNPKIALLHRIMTRTGARIVLDSSWREGWYGRNFVEEFEALKDRCATFGVWFLDCTEWPETGDRGSEIQRWIKRRTGARRDKLASFVIIDDIDAGISKKFPDNFVKTDERVGLTEEDAEREIQILGEEKE